MGPLSQDAEHNVEQPAQTVSRPPRLALLEVLDRDGQVRQSYIVDDLPFRVGRALDNDLVLSDPHVAPEHLRLQAGERGLVLVVGDTRNGVMLGSRQWPAGQQLPLPAEASPMDLTVGRTRLRLRLPGAALAPEMPLAAALARSRRMTPVVVAALVLLAGLVFTTYIESDPDGLGRAVAGMLVASISGAAIWCGLWSLLSKTFTRQAHFGWHLRVFLLASIAWMLLDVVPKAVSFAFSWPALASFGFIANLGVGAAALYFHLLAVEPARPRLLRWVTTVGWIAGVAVMMWFNMQRTDRLGENLYMSHLFPPVLRLARPVPVDTFIDGLKPLQAVLDKKAKEPASGESNGASDEE